MRKLPSLILLTLIACTAALLFLVLWGIVFQTGLRLLLGPELSRSLSFLSIVALFVIPWGRLKTGRPYDVIGEIEIDRPIAAVWDALELRQRSDYFAPTLSTVDDLGNGRFRFRADPDLAGRGVGLGRAGADVTVTVQVTAEVRGSRLRYIPEDASDLPLWGRDLVSTEYTLEAIGPGTTRVRLTERLRCLRVLSVLALLFLNPAKDGLEALKSRCEHSPQGSWMAAENAAMRKGGSSLTLNAVMIVGVTASLFLMGLAFALIRLAF